jgi:hypothetical protein
MLNLDDAATLAGWATPNVVDSKLGDRKENGQAQLCHQVHTAIAGWTTPQERDYRSANGSPEHLADRLEQTRGKMLTEQALGTTSTSRPAGTGECGVLNPEFVAWLMGFPVAWLNCVDWATRSSRKSRRNS